MSTYVFVNVYYVAVRFFIFCQLRKSQTLRKSKKTAKTIAIVTIVKKFKIANIAEIAKIHSFCQRTLCPRTFFSLFCQTLKKSKKIAKIEAIVTIFVKIAMVKIKQIRHRIFKVYLGTDLMDFKDLEPVPELGSRFYVKIAKIVAFVKIVKIAMGKIAKF